MAVERVTCALCGEREATAREHVPARSLFPDPRPDDLITVPSCAPCNLGSQKDDDYFRDSIALIDEPSRSAELERVRRTVTRALARPQERGLRSHFADRLSFGPLPGLLIHQPLIRVDQPRMSRVAAKHSLGVYHTVMQQPLSPAYVTVTMPSSRLNYGPPEDRAYWEDTVMRLALAGYTHAVGDGTVFRFGFNVAQDNPHVFVAVLLYYDNFAWLIQSIPLTAAPAREVPP